MSKNAPLFTADKKREIKTALVLGAGGSLAQMVTQHLKKKYPGIFIIGIDDRRNDANTYHRYIQSSYTRYALEAIFQEYKIDLLVHIGRLIHPENHFSTSLRERIDLGLMRTGRILDLCQQYDIAKLVVISSFHVYGAQGDNPLSINEEYPLRASVKHPELRGVVEIDQMLSNWMWKNQNKKEVIILRPCHIIGKNLHNAMTRYLRAEHSYFPMDFLPMLQFIDSQDVARIIVESIGHISHGIFNIAPDDFISLGEVFTILDKKKIIRPFSMPYFFLHALAPREQKIPPYLIDFLKFSCLISSEKIKQQLGAKFHCLSSRETISKISL